jgi:hypothetical protein
MRVFPNIDLFRHHLRHDTNIRDILQQKLAIAVEKI